MDIKQVKHDFENGTLICRATIEKVIDMALEAANPEPQLCEFGNEDDFDEAHDEWERQQRYAVVGAMEYNGNTVSYMYSKAKNYGNVVCAAHNLIGKPGHVLDTLKALIAERDALLDQKLAWISSASSHPDDFAIDKFATALKAKMALGRKRGRNGWNDPMLCSVDSLRRLLVESVGKGDPVDVGNFAMMLFNRDART